MIRSLPIFPLPLVLLPGATMPLHIFELRYQRMLDDCLVGDREFGIVCIAAGEQERDIPPGRVGCVARIEDTASLPDGRSNIIVSGRRRFALRRFIESAAPYHVAEVEPFEDEAPADGGRALAELATEVRVLFARIAGAARTLADDRAPIPVLPADPGELAFAIAAMVDLDLAARQSLLAERSALERLRAIERVMAIAVLPLEERAAGHDRAKSNGKHAH